MPGAGCQVGVARTSGHRASPVTDSLYLSAMRAVGLLERLPAADGGRPAAERHLVIAHVREQRERRAVGDRRLPLLVSFLVELRARQDHLAAVDLRAKLHLGAVVRRQRRQADRDGRRQRRGTLALAALRAGFSRGRRARPACSRGRRPVTSSPAPRWPPGWPRRSDPARGRSWPTSSAAARGRRRAALGRRRGGRRRALRRRQPARRPACACPVARGQRLELGAVEHAPLHLTLRRPGPSRPRCRPVASTTRSRSTRSSARKSCSRLSPSSAVRVSRSMFALSASICRCW